MADLETSHATLDHTGLPGVGGGGSGTVIRKTADQSVNASTTLVNVTDLVQALGASEVWQFEGHLYFDSGTTPDLKVAFTVPAGATLKWSILGHQDPGGTLWAGVVETGSGVAQAIAAAGVGTPRLLKLYGLVVNGATPGNLQMQFAQNTSNASNSTIQANSILVVRQLV